MLLERVARSFAFLCMDMVLYSGVYVLLYPNQSIQNMSLHVVSESVVLIKHYTYKIKYNICIWYNVECQYYSIILNIVFVGKGLLRTPTEWG